VVSFITFCGVGEDDVKVGGDDVVMTVEVV